MVYRPTREFFTHMETSGINCSTTKLSAAVTLRFSGLTYKRVYRDTGMRDRFKNFYLFMAISVKFHRLWWRLHMNEQFSRGTGTPDKQTKYIFRLDKAGVDPKSFEMEMERMSRKGK